MAEVKINRELLTDIVDALVVHHLQHCDCLPHPGITPMPANPCPTGQRILRGQGLLERTA